MNEKIKSLMKCLGCSEEMAKQIIADDERIDKGEKLFELTQEQEKNAKKYRQGDRKETVYKFDKKERKVDIEKRHLIELLAATLAEVADTEPTVVRVEGEVAFEYKGRKFKIVLSAPRS